MQSKVVFVVVTQSRSLGSVRESSVSGWQSAWGQALESCTVSCIGRRLVLCEEPRWFPFILYLVQDSFPSLAARSPELAVALCCPR